MDVQEIDGASYNGVDEVRRLQEGLAVPARARPLQDLHRGRGPHALERGVERVPEDARGAAAAREVHLRDDRGAQGPGHHPEPLPALRLQARSARSRSPRASSDVLGSENIAADDARGRRPRARGRGLHARRDEPARSGHRLVGGDESSPPRTWRASSASPTARSSTSSRAPSSRATRPSALDVLDAVVAAGLRPRPPLARSAAPRPQPRRRQGLRRGAGARAPRSRRRGGRRRPRARAEERRRRPRRASSPASRAASTTSSRAARSAPRSR